MKTLMFFIFRMATFYIKKFAKAKKLKPQITVLTKDSPPDEIDFYID